MRQLFGFSDPKKFRRSDDLLIKLLRIPVHHDRVTPNSSPTLLLYTAHRHHKIRRERYMRSRRTAPRKSLHCGVSRNELFDLKIIIIRIYRAHAPHRSARIAHAGVLPVDQADITVRQEQEIVAHTVDVGQDLRPVQDGRGGRAV